MTFITDNYIWFIVAGFVLLMITIGYYAEKTNFGKRKLNEKEVEIEKLDLIDSTSIPVVHPNVEQALPNKEISSNFSDVTPGNQEIENLESFDVPPIPDVPFTPLMSSGVSQPISSKEVNESSKVESTSEGSIATSLQTDEDIWKF